MENQIPEDVVKDRFNRLLSLVQEKGRISSARFEGSVQEVLVEEEKIRNRSLQEERSTIFLYIFRDQKRCLENM